MKNFLNKCMLIALVATTFLTSCKQLTEEIYINEDGSGEYLLYTDAVGTMRNSMIEMDKLFTPDSIRANETEDEKMVRIEERIWQDFPEQVDSIMDVSERTDTTEMTAESKEMMRRTIMFMKGGRAEGYVNMGLKYNFLSMDDLDNFIQEMADNQKNNPQTQGMFSDEMMAESEMDFIMSKKKFSRKHTIVKKPTLSDPQLTMMETMMSGKVKTIVHLPRKVKKVKGAHFVSQDGKTVTFEYDLLDYIKGDLIADFEIRMGKK